MSLYMIELGRRRGVCGRASDADYLLTSDRAGHGSPTSGRRVGWGADDVSGNGVPTVGLASTKQASGPSDSGLAAWPRAIRRRWGVQAPYTSHYRL